MKYKSLKEGWLPYVEACNLYDIKADRSRLIRKIPDEYKEQIGRTWVINIKWFEAYIRGNIKIMYDIL